MRTLSLSSIGLVGGWLIAVTIGLVVLMNYEFKPGMPAAAPVSWPTASKIKPTGKDSTLVMVIHPYCYCTRASIGELSQLLSKEYGKVTAYLLFWTPKGTPTNWEKTDLWHSAAAIPGVTVLPDENGIEANRFRATTSGQTMIYSKSGKLLFSGGITLGRGHLGDNAGLDTAEAIFNKEPLQQKSNLVFGCSLLTPTSK
jgi:hypothetical protein